MKLLEEKLSYFVPLKEVFYQDEQDGQDTSTPKSEEPEKFEEKEEKINKTDFSFRLKYDFYKIETLLFSDPEQDNIDELINELLNQKKVTHLKLDLSNSKIKDID